MTRQRRWLDKMSAQGRCITCAEPAVTRAHCRVHADRANAWGRRRWANGKVAPEKNAVRTRVWDAIRRGFLVRPETCSRCGVADPKINAHHEDYSKPLDVQWLCYRCHAAVEGRTA